MVQGELLRVHALRARCRICTPAAIRQAGLAGAAREFCPRRVVPSGAGVEAGRRVGRQVLAPPTGTAGGAVGAPLAGGYASLALPALRATGCAVGPGAVGAGPGALGLGACAKRSVGKAERAREEVRKK